MHLRAEGVRMGEGKNQDNSAVEWEKSWVPVTLESDSSYPLMKEILNLSSL